MEELREIFASRGNKGSRYITKKYLDGYLRIAKMFGALSFYIFLAVSFPPIISLIIFGEMKPSLNYWFPIDIFRWKIFPLALLWMDLAAYFFSIFQLGTDMLLYALITVIAMEFDFLKGDFRELGLEASLDRVKRTMILIDRHNKLLELSDKLQDIYSPIFLLGFVISSVIECLVLFQLLTVESESNSFLLPFLVLMGCQILLLCIFGQKLITSSSEVADGIYDCDWVDFDDIDSKKKIILILMRGQRSKKLTAMKFADVSLESFKNVSFNLFWPWLS